MHICGWFLTVTAVLNYTFAYLPHRDCSFHIGHKHHSINMSKSIRSFFAPAISSNKKPRIEVAAAAVSGGKVDCTPDSVEVTAKTSSLSSETDQNVAPPSVTTAPTTATGTSGASGWPPLDGLEPGWRNALQPQFDRPYFRRLMQYLSSEVKSHTVYPPSNEIFMALNLCPLDEVKVVVIGQDPYHGPGQAHGLAFSVKKGIQIPPSLRNMITEAQNDVGIKKPINGDLTCWAQQGVLMLNTVLTVRKGEANSHQKKGWEDFTDAIVKELRKKQDIVYLLWGKPAQNKCSGIDPKNNVIITCSHPSPLAAYKTNEPFISSKCFSRCNAALENFGQTPINWEIK